MALNLANYEKQARGAVKAFWGNRAAAKQKQIESGKADQGERAGVTSGKNMDGFADLIVDLVARMASRKRTSIKSARCSRCLDTSVPPSCGTCWSCAMADCSLRLNSKARLGLRLATTSTTGLKKPSARRMISGPRIERARLAKIPSRSWAG